MAVHAEGRPSLYQKMRKVPEVLTLSPPASAGPKPSIQPVAFHSVGPGHRRSATPNSIKQKMADSSYGLLHKVGRSGASVIHHRARHKELCLEKHHHEIWNPSNSHLRQWDPVRFQLLQKLLPGVRHPKHLLHPGVPTKQWPGRDLKQSDP